jgi:hypothetical protein
MPTSLAITYLSQINIMEKQLDSSEYVYVTKDEEEGIGPLSWEERYEEWFRSLDKDQQKIYNLWMKNSTSMGGIISKGLNDRLTFGLNLSSVNFNNVREFVNDEILDAYRELGKTTLFVNWKCLNYIYIVITDRFYNRPVNDPDEIYIFQNEMEIALLFWSVFSSDGETDNFVYLPKPQSDQLQEMVELINSNPIIDKFAQFTGVYMFLMGLVCDTYFLGKSEKGKRSRNLIKLLTFPELFRDEGNAQIVKNILEIKGYTRNGIWIGITGAKNELLGAYYALRPILKSEKITPRAKIFYREFGLPDGYMSDRMMTNEPFDQSRDEFDRMFAYLMPK